MIDEIVFVALRSLSFCDHNTCPLFVVIVIVAVTIGIVVIVIVVVVVVVIVIVIASVIGPWL